MTAPGDLVGLVAYSLYKERKRDWIVAHRADRDGAEPSAEALKEFARQMLLPGSVSDLRQKAERGLVAYSRGVVEQETPRIREAVITGEITATRDELRAAQGFWRQVLQAFIVSVVTTAMLVLLAIAIGLFGIDIVDGGATVRDTLAP